MNVSSHIVYNNRRVKTASIFISEAIVKQNDGYSPKGILFRNKILMHVRIWMKSENMINKGDQKQNATNNMLSFM